MIKYDIIFNCTLVPISTTLEKRLQISSCILILQTFPAPGKASAIYSCRKLREKRWQRLWFPALWLAQTLDLRLFTKIQLVINRSDCMDRYSLATDAPCFVAISINCQKLQLNQGGMISYVMILCWFFLELSTFGYLLRCQLWWNSVFFYVLYRNVVVYNTIVPPEVDIPSSLPTSIGVPDQWQAWLMGAVVTIGLPFLTNKWGPLVGWIGKI